MAQESADERPAGLEERIVELVRRRPGRTPADVRHELRKRRAGRYRTGAETDRALRRLLRGGRIVAAEVAIVDGQGRARTRSRLYVPHARPASRGLKLTGDELGARRVGAGLSQQRLGSALGKTGGFVGYWERRGSAPVPEPWAARLLEELASTRNRPDPTELARAGIVSAVAQQPGLSRWRLQKVVGNGNSARRALHELLHSGELVSGRAFDRLGRQYVGLYQRDQPKQRGDAFRHGELRHVRETAGWTAGELAVAIGARASTVTRWESGARHCPPRQVTAVRTVLAGPRPDRARDERRLARLLALVAPPEGARLTELLPFLSSDVGRATFEAALAGGLIHEEERTERDRQGRPYRRRRVVTGPARADAEPPPATLTGADLRTAREAAGLSQGELARRLGLSQSMVSRWELGLARVPLGHLERVWTVLGGLTANLTAQ